MTGQSPAIQLRPPVRARRIGEQLVSQGAVSEDQLCIALTEQCRSKERIGQILVRLGFATETLIRTVLGSELGHDSVDLDKVSVDADVVKLIPQDVARRFRMLALSFNDDKNLLTVAMVDPLNVIALDQVRAVVQGGVQIQPLLCGETEIDRAIDRYYGLEFSIDGILQEIQTGAIDHQSLEAQSNEYSSPVIRLVNALLSDAVKRGASDVHFEPEHDFLRIRLRVDGVLRQSRSVHRNYWPAIAVRLKVMAGVDIAETRAPQDGRMSLSVSGRPIDFRVSALPTTCGENIVLRVLDRQKGILPLMELGLEDRQFDTLRLMMARPEGIILVTGPTGSGKTTTLYSMLNHLNTGQVNIMTLEDPVEYPMEQIRQTSVNEVARLNFANGIRSLLRQDPDIILVGEIRDEDTAQMTFRAAMTGHQVFSTLHSNSAVGAVARLYDTGIRPEVMAGNVIGIIGQRLVRKLCAHCKHPYAPSSVERRLLRSSAGADALPLYRAFGCGRCDHSGYKGRLALLELFRFDSETDEQVAQGRTPPELLKTAISKGFTTMADDGIRRVREGFTSMAEVSRVLDLTGIIN